MASRQPLWRIELFGALRARSGERIVEHFQTQKAALLLATLANYPRRVHTRESLIDMLWPDAEEDAGRNRLSQALGWLRTQLEPTHDQRGQILIADRYHIALNMENVSTDVAEFRALLTASREGAPQTEISRKQREALEKAVALYQGDLLAGYYEEWILEARHSDAASMLEALNRLAQSAEAQGDWERALDYTRRALALDTTDESLHGDLIRRLAASGQTALALRQYREMERILEKELGAAPSNSIRDLLAQIQNPEAERTPFSPPVETLAPSLPAQGTRFFGRGEILLRIEELMSGERARLITFVGAGGAGKTRLAIEAATRLAPDPNAVWFVPLQELTDGRMLPALLTNVMGLPQGNPGNPLDQAAAALAGRSALIVFDNAEHLLESVTQSVRSLMERVPNLRIWVTSRQKLNLGAEREIAIPPLPVPALERDSPIIPDALMRIDSVQLFVDRAQAVRPSFAVTPQNGAAIAQLCAQLEGIPLALELCAAWAQTLTPEQMLAQLTRRFDLLVSRRTDIEKRHRSLRAAIEYSYLQLPPDLQRLFARLSIFRGGCNLDAATQICSDVPGAGSPLEILAAITELRERSLVVAEEGNDAEMRYRMLETLREFAERQQMLAEEMGLRRRYTEYFLSLAETARSQVSTPSQNVWLTKLETEHDNMRSVLAWVLERADSDPSYVLLGLRLVIALEPLWGVRGYYAEGYEWIERALAQAMKTPDKSPDQIRLEANAYHALTEIAALRGDFSKAKQAGQSGLELARLLGDPRLIVAALQHLGGATNFQEPIESKAYLQEALALARGIQDAVDSTSLFRLGNIAIAEGNWEEAWDLYSECLELSRIRNNRNSEISVLSNLGLVARYQGRFETAKDLLEEALEGFRKSSHQSNTAITLLNLGTVLRLSGRLGAAGEALMEALRICHEIDDRRAFAWCIKEIGHLASAKGDYRASMALLAAAESFRLALAMTFHPADPDALSQEIQNAHAVLTEDQYATAWLAGGLLTFSQAYHKAMTWLVRT